MAAQHLRLAVVKVTAMIATVTPEAGRAGLPNRFVPKHRCGS
jgi:hypothetical protein